MLQTNTVYNKAATFSKKKAEHDRKKKMTTEAKDSRRQSKHSRVHDTDAAHKTYSRYNNEIRTV